MKESPILTIWFHRETKQFYQVPRDVLFEAGELLLERFDGAEKKVKADSLNEYNISQDEVESILHDNYTKQVEVAKKATMALSEFSVLVGKTKDSLDELLDTGKSPLMNDTKEWFENFMQNVNNKEASEEDQKKQFQQTMGKIPELLSFFGEEELKKAAENPEEWANNMQEKVFGEQDRARKKANKEKLQKEINEQIRKNIENAMKNQRKSNKEKDS